MNGLADGKFYLLRVKEGAVVHDIGGPLKVGWVAGVKPLEPFRINLHGSRLFYDAFTKVGLGFGVD